MNPLLHLVRVYPFEKGRNRILRVLESAGVLNQSADGLEVPVKLSSGAELFVLGDEYMSNYIRAWGSFEKKTENFIISHLRPGKVFLDVGANLGYFSIIAKTVVPGCEVAAVEPNPPLIKLLKKSRERNPKLSGIAILEIALSKESGWLPLICAEDNSGLSHLGTASPDAGTGDNPQTVSVKVEVWDEYAPLNGWDRETSVMKMDIEGAEMDALRGMKSWLSKWRPAVVVEANDDNLARFGNSRAELEAFFLDFGYKHALPADNNFYLVAG